WMQGISRMGGPPIPGSTRCGPRAPCRAEGETGHGGCVGVVVHQGRQGDAEGASNATHRLHAGGRCNVALDAREPGLMYAGRFSKVGLGHVAEMPENSDPFAHPHVRTTPL